jgi:probable phosphoglycerate mutase
VRLVLVRHGATEWSVSGRHTGRTDLPLSAAGREQAKDIRARVLSVIDKERSVYTWSSPLQRARVTAELIMGAAACTIDDRLREFDYGDYEGLTTAEIRERSPGWTVFDGCPGGETVADVVARVDSFLGDVRGGPEAIAVIFAHGHLLRILGARAVNQAGDFGRHLGLDTASVSVIDDLRDGPAITLWNEIGHD